MFFESEPYYGNHYFNGNHSSTLRSLQKFESELLEAKENLLKWSRDLEAKESCLNKRENTIVQMERRLDAQATALKKRVAVLNATDQQNAIDSQKALERAAATVIQRATRRYLQLRQANYTLAGLRKIRALGQNFKKAKVEFLSGGNLPLLEDTLTKLLEQADGISTQNCQSVLRAKRKALVRRIIAVLDDPHGLQHESYNTDDDMSLSSGSEVE